ncbi:MAG: hypothetical protein AWU57_43 [Marinobacter sp. T13-3]|nr:MAG: hypothetical protein AWU57_43 [Marinobacter sp. T13-3]
MSNTAKYLTLGIGNETNALCGKQAQNGADVFRHATHSVKFVHAKR